MLLWNEEDLLTDEKLYDDFGALGRSRVQSIISLTKPLGNNLFGPPVQIKSSVLKFFAEKNAKSSSHFFG